MSERTKTVLKSAALGVVALGAAAALLSAIGGLSRRGEEGARVWFYDQSEKRLYAAPRETVPPDRGIGGASGDGVRAVVVAPRSHPRDLRVAYLETYTPELKARLEAVLAARAAGRPCEGEVPQRDGDYFQKNTLVSRPDEGVWHASDTPEARKIVSEWRSWRGPDGQPLVISAP